MTGTGPSRRRGSRIVDRATIRADPANVYDEAINGLEQLLQPYTLEFGFHCTRLTDAEADTIRREGMKLQNAASLRARIQSLVSSRLIDEETAHAFSNSNSADESNRAGMTWFCFFPPHRAGQGGIERFFRYWGGEALYLWHQRDSARRAVLERIGTPSIVIADLPIRHLNNSFLSTKIVLRYFQNRGFDTREDLDHEGYTTSPVPPDAIHRIVRFPEPDFIRLTQCDTWQPGLI